VSREPGAWSRRELAALTRLAETFVVGDMSPRLAGVAAERFDRGLDPSQVRRLRLALWLMEQGIDSVSLNPDSVIETWLYLAGKTAR
jgi:hypothetical protein